MVQGRRASLTTILVLEIGRQLLPGRGISWYAVDLWGMRHFYPAETVW